MASQNAARLGIVLAVDSAELKTKISEAEAAFDGLAKSAQSATKRAAKDLQDLIYQTADYGKTLTKVELIERQIAAGRYKNADKSMIDALRLQAKAYDDVAKAQKNVTDGMTQQQKMALTYQTTDLFTQIASGQNPMIALIQQGGQLKDSMGGLGNMFRMLGTFVTPANVAMGAFAVTLGAVAIAAYQADKELDKFKDTMALTGNYTKLSYDQFNDLATVLGDRMSVGTGKAKDAIMALVATGQYTDKTISAVSQAVLNYSKIAGVDAATAAQKLAGGLNGTASGAASLNKEMNFLTLEQYKQIAALERAGKTQDAIQIATVALNTKLQQQARDLGVLEGAWNKVTKAMSDYWDKFKNLIAGPSQSETLASLDKQIADIEEKLKGSAADEDTAFARGWRKILQTLKDSKENILEIQRLQNRSATAKSVTGQKEAINNFIAAGDIAKGVQLQNEYNKLVAANKIEAAKQGASEIQAIELDAQKRKDDVLRDMAQKNEAERFVFATQNKKIADQQIIAIEIDTQNKLRAIRDRNRIAEYNEYIRTQEEISAAEVAEDQRRAAIRTSAQNETKSLENAKEMIELQNRLVYMTEKEQKLAEVSLKYEQKRREIVGQADEEFLKTQLDKQQAIENFNIELQDKTLKSQQVFNNVYSAMGNAIDNFVKGGKTKFKDFAQSIIRDMIAMQMKAQALQIMRYAFNFFTGPSMGPSPSGGGALDASFNQYLTPKANGGPVYDGTPYMVGERGPELFVPNGSGTIIPNNALENIGGSTVNNYFNISAIDSKSFEERLMSSPNAVWAANKYGEKILATTYGRT